MMDVFHLSPHGQADNALISLAQLERLSASQIEPLGKQGGLSSDQHATSILSIHVRRGLQGDLALLSSQGGIARSWLQARVTLVPPFLTRGFSV